MYIMAGVQPLFAVLSVLLITSNSQDSIKNYNCGKYPEYTSAAADLKFRVTECGVRYYNTRIYNGEESRRNEYPWLALIEIRESLWHKLECGGSLINNFYVLTVAHCLPKGAQSESIYVFLGMHDKMETYNGYIKTYKAQNFVKHLSYKNHTSGSDIGLIKLSEEVQFSRTVSPICLPEWELTGSDLLFAGWGKTEYGQYSNYLKHTRLIEMSDEQCFGALKTFTDVDARQLLPLVTCTYQPTGVPCQGDSGGPIMSYMKGYDHYLILTGLLSFGRDGDCPDPKRPKFNLLPVFKVFTKITPFLNWIYSETKDSSYCVKPYKYKIRNT